jgi:hypothetical protein
MLPSPHALKQTTFPSIMSVKEHKSIIISFIYLAYPNPTWLDKRVTQIHTSNQSHPISMDTYNRCTLKILTHNDIRVI